MRVWVSEMMRQNHELDYEKNVNKQLLRETMMQHNY